jgi:hypothetical protein
MRGAASAARYGLRRPPCHTRRELVLPGMKKNTTTKLPLRTQTVRTLTDGELTSPRGGALIGGYSLSNYTYVTQTGQWTIVPSTSG